MRRSVKALLIATLLLAAMWASAQTGEIGAPTPSTTGIRVIAPSSGQKFGTNIVAVRFELTNPQALAATTPNFRLQLDTTDPVTTTSTDYTFTGLAPGNHKLTIVLVDANQTPVAGTEVVVPFVVAQQAQQPASPRSELSPLSPPQYVPTSYLTLDERDTLPNSGSALPLLSVIGFGVLVGGIATAMKTR